MAKRKKQSRKTVRYKTPEKCPFDSNPDNVPSYLEYQTLSKFLTERGKIVGKDRTGVSSKCQRVLTLEIKRARHLGLLPFAPGR